MTHFPATAPFGMTPVEIIAFARSICHAATEMKLTSTEQLLAACRHALAALCDDLCRIRRPARPSTATTISSRT